MAGCSSLNAVLRGCRPSVGRQTQVHVRADAVQGAPVRRLSASICSAHSRCRCAPACPMPLRHPAGLPQLCRGQQRRQRHTRIRAQLTETEHREQLGLPPSNGGSRGGGGSNGTHGSDGLRIDLAGLKQLADAPAGEVFEAGVVGNAQVGFVRAPVLSQRLCKRHFLRFFHRAAIRAL